MKYIHNEIEAKWQKYWAENQTFKAQQPTTNNQQPKFYVLDMFPYPSGAGLHVGHPLGYIASDIVARYKRHQGYNVLHPQGYDSFGLPAEQYAIQTGQHPEKTTRENIARYREQLDKIGFSFDWSREVRTSNPEYYKWTQWIFIELFNSYYCKDTNQARPITELIEVFSAEGNITINAECDDNVAQFSAAIWNNFSEEEQQKILLNYRLTFLSETEVNWCPALGTVLANDEVINGVSERGGHPVIRKKMMQWSMRITAYAERLLQGLETIDWTESIKESQRNWIGKSVGALIEFPILTFPKGEGIPELDKKFGYLTGGNNINIQLKNAQEMRNKPTDAEKMLWNELKGKKLNFKFRQQHPIDNYIVDFVCLSKKIIIEVDGAYHNLDEQRKYDIERDGILSNLGYKILRFTNDEVIFNLNEVIEKIEKELSSSDKAPFSFLKSPSFGGVGEELLGVRIFTTRPDTIYGVTFLTLAPEHELVTQITTPEQKPLVDAYIEATAKRSERERMADVKTISGVFTGAYAEHPFTDELIPIWIGDYVLASYGTGAVMAVPAGDERDFAFAKHFDLPIKNIFNVYSDNSSGNITPNNSENKTIFLQNLTPKINTNRLSNLTPNPSPKERGTDSVNTKTEYFNQYNYMSADPKIASKLVEYAKEMRKEPTEAENILWQEIRNKKLGNKFRRQHYISNFIVDFVCLSKQLVIEIDGDIHDLQKEYDEERTNLLTEIGFKVIRFSNDEVLKNLDDVLKTIFNEIEIRPNFYNETEEFAEAPLSFGEGLGVRSEAFTAKENFTYINSDFLDGLGYEHGTKRIYAAIEALKIGTKKVNYRLRDAVFSRQRYWGEPIPIYYKKGVPYPIPTECLPLVLPEVEKYLPTEDGQPPLGNATHWAWDTQKLSVVSCQLIDHQAIFPLELNTMPGWAGSSWYWLRYMDAENPTEFANKETLNYWKDVDLYIGGSEHATGHLLYSRFWNKFLKDKGYISEEEPFKKLINQGMILGMSAFVYRDETANKLYSKGQSKDKKTVPIHVDLSCINDVTNELDIEKFINHPLYSDYKEAIFIDESGKVLSFGEDLGEVKFLVGREVEKMSKSKYNVVNPDDICNEYGADTLRLYEMFLGPLEQAKPWNTAGISGVYGFLKKLWKLYHSGSNDSFYINDEAPNAEAYKSLHKTIKKVTEDIENFSFNTSVSQFMICVNELTSLKCNNKAILEPLAILISPYAPHIAEELWEKLGHQGSIARATFPKFEEKYLVENEKEYPVSFNGKMRFTLTLPLSLSKDEIEKIVLADVRTQTQLAGKEPNKIIIVPGKIINLVG